MNNSSTLAVTIAGGTGLVGSHLANLLASKGYDVTILSRKQRSPAGKLNYASWDVEKGVVDDDAIRYADVIIHLAGENVGKGRWTAKRKKQILESRTRTSKVLIDAMKKFRRQRTFLSASAIGWYGPDPKIPNPQPFTEDMPSAPGFLGETCAAWEASVQPAIATGARVVILRTGIVLSRDGGAYPEYLKPIKLGVATIFGSGNQVVSWIHIDDLSRLYLYALENASMAGVYNAVAPNPVDNRTLMLTIAQQVRKSFFIPVYVPEFALKIALGEMSIEVLKSATVSSRKIHDAGFSFIYPSITSAIPALHR